MAKRTKKLVARPIPLPANPMVSIMVKDKAPLVTPPKKRRTKKVPKLPEVVVCPFGSKTAQIEAERAFNRRIESGLEKQREELLVREREALAATLATAAKAREARAARAKERQAAKLAASIVPETNEVPGTILESIEQIRILCRAASWECGW